VPPPPQAGGHAHSAYTRFIPREEVGQGKVAAWTPQTFEPPPVPPADTGVRKPTLAERAAAELRAMGPKGTAARHAPMGPGASAVHPQPAAAAAPAAAPRRPAVRPIVGGVPGQAEAQQQQAEQAAQPAPDIGALVQAARQEGYQDGYRNGLAALESYKQTQAAQLAAHMNDQIGALASDFHQRLEVLEQQLAGRMAGVALELARQVVRTELRQNPELVVDVAEQAIGVLLTSAREVMVRLHPEDHALAQAQLAEALATRGARLVADAQVSRGGCLVESDIAVVDASIEARWARAAAALGYAAPWHDGHEAHTRDDLQPLAPNDPDADELPPIPPGPGHEETRA
jgi:flagellar assembly protein FliH